MKTRVPGTSLLKRLIDDLFLCPSCSTWREPLRQTPFQIAARGISTLTSSTAVNAAKAVPTKYQGLYSALADVGRRAPAFIRLSRLQLAQQGLESNSPKIRIAVLGLNVQDTARRLVRLLLADALEDEAPWEKELRSIHGDQGILIAQGQFSTSGVPQSRTTIPTLHIPSSLLDNIEILVSAVSTPRNGDNRHPLPCEILLSPTVRTPIAVSGRQTMISQPVHSALIVSEGLDDFLSLSELLSAVEFSSKDEKDCIFVAVNLQDSNLKPAGTTLILDLTKAERGLTAIRRSIAEATAYEREWSDSGMLQASNLFSSLSSPPGTVQISEPLRRLLSSILSAAAVEIEHQILSPLSAQTSTVTLAARTNLEAAIEDFSRVAHQELQSGLASAWSSRNWKKLAWYKLFWRVDDVGLIISDLVSNAWLPRTERAAYELSGRLAQAGISPVDAPPLPIRPAPVVVNVDSQALQPLSSLQVQFAVPEQGAVAEQGAVESIMTNTAGAAAVDVAPIPQPQPLSVTISSIRAAQINRAINDLTSTAQQLVLRTLSITGLSAGLSGLTYLSLTPGNFYEAGTIVALGTAFALYRMQSGWLRATKALEENLFDEGRNAIQRVVNKMKELVQNASMVRRDDVEVRRLAEARESVEKAQAELQKLSQPAPKDEK